MENVFKETKSMCSSGNLSCCCFAALGIVVSFVGLNTIAVLRKPMASYLIHTRIHCSHTTGADTQPSEIITI